MSTRFYFDPPLPEDQFLAAVEREGLEVRYDVEGARQQHYYPVGKSGEDIGYWGWVDVEDGLVVAATRFGANRPYWIYAAGEEFDSKVISEYELLERDDP